jgi:hypothetical protein
MLALALAVARRSRSSAALSARCQSSMSAAARSRVAGPSCGVASPGVAASSALLRRAMPHHLPTTARPSPFLFSSARAYRVAAVVTAARRHDSVNLMAAEEDLDEDEEDGEDAPPPPPPAPTPLSPSAPIAAAIAAARAAAGRAATDADAVLADRLEGRGLLTAGEVAGLSAGDAEGLRLPRDLHAALAAAVGAWEGGAGPPGGVRARGRKGAAASSSAPRKKKGGAAAAAGGRGSAAVAAPTLRATSIPPPPSPPTPQPYHSPFEPAADDPPPADAAIAAIEARLCPPMDRFLHGSATAPDAPRIRPHKPPSAAPARSILRIAPGTSPRLDADLARFRKFMTARAAVGRQQAAIRPVTVAKYEDHVRRWAGWWAGVWDGGGADSSPPGPPSPAVAADRAARVSLADLIPGTGPDAAGLAVEYAAWLEDERGCTPHTSGLFLRSALAAAKWLHAGSSATRPRDGDKAYGDLGVVRELRGLSKDARAAGRRAPPVGDERVKWLEWGDYLSLVDDLRAEVAGRDAQGRPRSPAAVAWSLQRYLVFAILACVPDRQRTLRELELGRTLVWDPTAGGGGGSGNGSGGSDPGPLSGRWVIRHGPEDYKTGAAYGARPPLILSPTLYPELGAFISHYRAFLNPSHDFLFCMKTGAPLTAQALYRLFQCAAYRLTGQKTNPHLVRDMVVTHIRARGDATEAELEALALYMGHSVTMQRATYDRRTVAQKVEPAVDLLARLNGEAAAAAAGIGGGGGGGGRA